jgi:hypothetical protein
VDFFKRFTFQRERPRADWVSLVGDDLSSEAGAEEPRIWRFRDGDGVGVYFFDLDPDLPQSREMAPFLAMTKARVSAAGAALVECVIADLGDFQVVRQIVKVPQKPSGMTYLGSITLPFAKFSYVIKVQCQERGMSGVREAVLLSEMLQNGSVRIDRDSVEPIKGRWQPDSAEFDSRFPDHPLSRLRTHLQHLVSAVRIDGALLEHARFDLPTSESDPA